MSTYSPGSLPQQAMWRMRDQVGQGSIIYANNLLDQEVPRLLNSWRQMHNGTPKSPGDTSRDEQNS